MYYSSGRALHSVCYCVLDCLDSFALAGFEIERPDWEYSTCEICMDNMYQCFPIKINVYVYAYISVFAVHVFICNCDLFGFVISSKQICSLS